MPRKPKFKPEIRRIKLNPEQAVLQCDCYMGEVFLEAQPYKGLPIFACIIGVTKGGATQGECYFPAESELDFGYRVDSGPYLGTSS